MNNLFKISAILIVTMQTIIAFGQSTTTAQNSLKQVYKKAEKQFSEFEKKHGNFIATKNVKMHYLTWGGPIQSVFNMDTW